MRSTGVKPNARAKASARSRSGFSNSSHAMSATLMTGLRPRRRVAGSCTLLAVQLVVGAYGAAHRNLLKKLTKSSHAGPDQSTLSDEILKTDQPCYRKESDRSVRGARQPPRAPQAAHPRRARSRLLRASSPQARSMFRSSRSPRPPTSAWGRSTTISTAKSSCSKPPSPRCSMPTARCWTT